MNTKKIIMKTSKALSVFLCAVTLLLGMNFTFSSCSDDNDYTPPIMKKTNLEYLLEDYETVIAHYPVMDGHFMEARYELNGKISDYPAKELYPVMVTYCYYYFQEIEDEYRAAVVYHEREFKEGTTPIIIVEQATAPWVNGKIMPVKENYITLDQAIDNVKKSNCKDPETRFVTLRYPVIGGFDRGHALYVFGISDTQAEHVFVDALNGEVIVRDY